MRYFSQNDLSISDLFQGDLQLSSPPCVYFELQKLIENSAKAVADAAFIIEKDAALSLRLLKIVNSAFYGFPSTISSIDRAINLIGYTELQNITLSMVVMEKFSDLPGELLSMDDFWSRSLRCALIAQELDFLLATKLTDCIFACGILHHIGQLVFFRRLPELARDISLALQSSEAPTDQAEIRFENLIIGFDHYQVGAALSKRWGLPDMITQSIALHPYPDRIGAFQQIAAIIRTADYLSKTAANKPHLPNHLIALSTTDLTAILTQVNDKFDEIFQAFKLT